MNKGIKRLFSLVTFLSIAIVAFTQQVGSNSPYGRYGYGLLSNPSIGASESMGGISYGLRRSQQVNPGNPASYSRLDTLTFIFDIGVSGHYVRYSDGIDKQNFYNGNLDYIAMQFPLLKKMGASIGLLPYSKVGYNYGRVQSTTDFTYQDIYNGSGGISQIYAGVAWEPLKNVSVGANIGYLFGNIQHTRQLPLTVNSSTLSRISTDRFSIRDLKYDFGVQFTYPIDKQKSFTLGAVYSPKINSKATIYPFDRLVDQQGQLAQVLKTDTLQSQDFQFPQSFGLGVTYSNENFLIGVDGTYQMWKGVNYPQYLDGMTDDTRFNDRYRISAGTEYVIDPLSRNFFHRIRFRGGLSFANSYNNVAIYNPANRTELGTGGFKEYGVTFGLGLPFRDLYSGRVSMMNIGFGYSRLQPDKNYMIKEDMFKITLNMNINEYWFFKRQFD